MNECLVTKLKSVVNDENLDKLGVLTFNVSKLENPTDNTQWLNLDAVSNGSVVVKVVGDGYITHKTEGIVGSEITIPEGGSLLNSAYYLSNGNYKLEISPKYNIKALNVSKCFGSVNTSKLSALYDMESLNLGISNMYGDIKNLPSKLKKLIVINSENVYGSVAFLPITIEDLDIHMCPNVIGEYSDVSKLKNLKKLILYKNGVNPGNIEWLGALTSLSGTNNQLVDNSYGSIEVFVANQRNSGRVSCDSLGFKWLGAGSNNNVTFNGIKIEAQENNIISWTPSTITFNDITINA